MQALSKTVYIVTSQPEPDWEQEVNRWYDQEHLPMLLAVPGYRSGRRYVAVEGEPKYMAFWEIDSLAAYQSPEHDAVNLTPWSKKIRPHNRSQLGFYEQTQPAEGLMPGPDWGAEAGALMVMRLSVGPGHDADFNAWYGEEHLPALCRVPGVIAARRFRAIGDTKPSYMAMYYLREPGVQTSEGWRRAVETPWTYRVRETYTERSRGVYRPY